MLSERLPPSLRYTRHENVCALREPMQLASTVVKTFSQSRVLSAAENYLLSWLICYVQVERRHGTPQEDMACRVSAPRLRASTASRWS